MLMSLGKGGLAWCHPVHFQNCLMWILQFIPNQGGQRKVAWVIPRN